MKKIIFTLLVVFTLGLTNMVQAQDCRAIVRPLVILRGIDTSWYPAEKLEFFCQFSQNALFTVQSVPEGAIVHNIGEVTDLLTRQKAPQNMVADLNTLSYWQYDFDEFRPRDYKQPIYFRMGGEGSSQYLGVRCNNEAMARTNHPEEFKD